MQGVEESHLNAVISVVMKASFHYGNPQLKKP